MPNGSGDIIIKGGSVDLVYNEDLYPRDPKDPHSHLNERGKITRVVISGGITFDSGEYPEGVVCTITTKCTS